MDKAAQEDLAVRLYVALREHMEVVEMMTRAATGIHINSMKLVDWMETDLRREIGRIGTEPSIYSAEELKVRKAIAEKVVTRIRRDVEANRR